jgi:heme-degrading monooxygenase HmoA
MGGIEMHTRVLTFTGAKNVDDGIAFVRDKAVSVVRQQKGYRGLTASADRAGGVLGILSVWETEADRDASSDALAGLRQEGLGVVGGELTVENFEQVVEEVAAPPAPGAALMVTRTSMDPAKVDENLDFFKSEIVPQIKASPGFLALRNMIDRPTGRGIVGSVWADQDAMKQAATAAQSRRQQGIARGVSFEGDSYREIVFADMR